jgi:hypothetical protein
MDVILETEAECPECAVITVVREWLFDCSGELVPVVEERPCAGCGEAISVA